MIREVEQGSADFLKTGGAVQAPVGGIVGDQVRDGGVEGDISAGEAGSEVGFETGCVFGVGIGKRSVWISWSVTRGGDMMRIKSPLQNIHCLPNVAGVITESLDFPLSSIVSLFGWSLLVKCAPPERQMNWRGGQFKGSLGRFAELYDREEPR